MFDGVCRRYFMKNTYKEKAAKRQEADERRITAQREGTTKTSNSLSLSRQRWQAGLER